MILDSDATMTVRQCVGLSLLLVFASLVSTTVQAQSNSIVAADAEQPTLRATATPLPTIAPAAIRKAYMNCQLDVDETKETSSLSSKVRRIEAETKMAFCENRRRDCSLKKDGPDCRTFVEEFAED